MEILLMVLGLIIAGGLFFAARYRGLVLRVRELEYQLADIGQLEAARPESAPTTATGVLPGAGRALAKPPTSFGTVIQHMEAKGPSRYRIPLGWYLGPHGGHLHTAQLQGDVNHMLISGQSDSGKDNLALGMMVALAKQYGPERVQFAICDGKGLDWIGWQGKAHTWLLATDPEQIAPAMASLTTERQRRRGILAAAGASKWDNYQGGDLPLLVVFVSELLLLENAVGSKNLTAWLNTELTAARAFGIRYILATQTASNFSTQWRSQISLFVAGYQPSPSQDAPNVAISTNEVDQAGAVPPSRLPAPSSGAAGVFCIVQGSAAINVRTTFIDDAPGKQRDYLLSQLPTKPLQQPVRKAPKPAQDTATTVDFAVLQGLLQANAPLPIEPESVEQSYRASEIAESGFVERSTGRRTESISPSAGSTATSYIELPLPADIVPYEEQRRIIEAAPTVKSKRQLSLKLYNVDGGQKSTWVKLVCEATGLLA